MMKYAERNYLRIDRLRKVFYLALAMTKLFGAAKSPLVARQMRPYVARILLCNK